MAAVQPRRVRTRERALLAAAVCACLSAAHVSEAAASEYIADTEHFPGWKGALPAVDHAAGGAEDRHSRVLSVGALGKVCPAHCGHLLTVATCRAHVKLGPVRRPHSM